VRALVLARGLGTRMRAAGDERVALDPAQASAAAAGLKAMIPFGEVPGGRSESRGRPFLDHVLHRLADGGVRAVALVIGPEHEEIRSYYRSLDTRRLAVSFVTQAQPIGTADAVAAGETWVGDDPFLVLNADNLYPVDVIARLVSASGPAVPAFDRVSLALPPDRLGTFALMERDARGCLSRIIEKPGEAAIREAGDAAAISMNIWRFDRRIFPFCRSVPWSSRGEQELPQAVGLAASAICFEMFDARGPVLDLSRRSDIGAVARALAGAQVDL
jgi:glucose-1-phosphate thymidylyltransferase